MINLVDGSVQLVSPGLSAWTLGPMTRLDTFLATPPGRQSRDEGTLPDGLRIVRGPDSTLENLEVVPYLHFAGQQLVRINLMRRSKATGWDDVSEREPELQHRENQAWLQAHGWNPEKRLAWGEAESLHDSKTPGAFIILTFRRAAAKPEHSSYNKR